MTPARTVPGVSSGQKILRVLLADDDSRLRSALRSLLEEIMGITVVGEAADGLHAVRLARELRPDVVLMDVLMPGLGGIEATRQSLASVPGLRVLAVSVHAAKSYADAMLAAGASGYVLKQQAAEELEPALRALRDGRTWLSPGLL